jgi:hypothetical protein
MCCGGEVEGGRGHRQTARPEGTIREILRDAPRRVLGSLEGTCFSAEHLKEHRT